MNSCIITQPGNETCNEFRSGSFKLNLYNKGSLGHWQRLTYFITRNDSVDYVTSIHFPNDTSIYRITWMGKCEYKSVLLNPKNDLDSFLIRSYPTGINHKVLKVTEDYFLVKNLGRKDTIWKMK